MEDTAAAAPYWGEVSETGRGRGDLLCRALYASADVELVDFARRVAGTQESRNEVPVLDLDTWAEVREHNNSIVRRPAMLAAIVCELGTAGILAIMRTSKTSTIAWW